jgi:hypothetical protein
MKKAIANTGNFFNRVEQNVKNGWSYPSAIVTRMQPAGRSGNVTHYYTFDGERFSKIAEIPQWAGANGKYKSDCDALKSARKKGLKQYSIQEFVKNQRS